MFRGRTPRKAKPVAVPPVRSSRGLSADNPVRRAAEPVELLEGRRLLTTLVGGQDFHYFDANANIIRIRLVGDITAEFTAARIRESDNSVVIRDLIAANPPGVTQVAEGADLFNIYIAQAAPDAQIIITEVPTTVAADRLATPYTGAPGVIRAFSNDPDDGVTDAGDTVTPDATGSVYLGARTVDLEGIEGDDEADLPITSQRFRRALGVRPASRAIFAGIESAPNVSLNKIFIGGTITGIVNIEGSVGTFYVGNILTGSAGGLSTGEATGIRNNFTIAGDLQNLYVGGSVGTNVAGNYRTGVNMRIGGKLGYQNVGNSFNASVSVLASPSAPTITTPSEEAEYILQPRETPGLVFLQGLLSGAQFNNDTANQPFTNSVGEGQTMSWSGTLQGAPTADFTDNYSLPLLAGQAVAIQATSLLGGVNVGVFDPLGRLVATDLPDPAGNGANPQFQITAQLPGVYRLAIGFLNNTAFLPDSSVVRGTSTYNLAVTGVGNVSFGGAEVGNITRFREPGNGVAIRTGDLGGWVGVGNVSGATLGYGSVASSPIALSRGNLRALYGNNVGIETPNTLFESLDLSVPRGSVGFIRAANDVSINSSAQDLDGNAIPSAAIGGDYQRVQAGGALDSALVANGSIGTLIADTIQANTLVNFQPVFSANTDQRGTDGNIDMIYVTGDVGTAGNAGGPALFTGLNGNVKYFFVGGTLIRDPFFGGLSTEQDLTPGQALRVQDDSGTNVVVQPTPVVTRGTPAGTVVDPITGTFTNPVTGAVSTRDPGTGLITTTTPGTLSARTYGVRGTGGVVLVSVESSTGVDVIGTGTGGSVDISQITTNGNGSAVLRNGTNVGYQRTITVPGTPETPDTPTPPFVPSIPGADPDPVPPGGSPTPPTNVPPSIPGADPDPVPPGGTPTTPTTPTTPGTPTTTRTVFTTTPSIPNEMNFRGTVPVNVMSLTGNNITAIYNYTAGEIASVNATSLGTIVAETIGGIQSTTGGQVVIPTNLTGTGGGAGGGAGGDEGTGGNSGAAAAFPFDGFSRGINVTGSAISILARAGTGAINVGGTLGVLNPNVDARNARGRFDGINGPARADTFNFVLIGEGVGFGGTGALANAGIFANSAILGLTGVDADIRGPVVSTGIIGTINLTNGSIVNTFVGTPTSFDQALFTARRFTVQEAGTAFALNSLNLFGDGGIIGSSIAAGSFGTIRVDGFGILGSSIAATATGRPNGAISAGGFGIRMSNITVGSSVDTVEATGNGRVLSVSDYNGRVQQTGGARRRRFDAFSGRTLDYSNDLNRFFGTSRTTPRISGITNSGVIGSSNIAGNGNLGTLSAYSIVTSDTETGLDSSRFPMRVVFANTIGTINVANSISGLQLRSGGLSALNVGENIQRASIGVAGELGEINVGRTVRGTTSILTQGGNGRLGSIVVRGGLYGSINANAGIGTIAAGLIGSTIATSGAIGRIGVTDDVISGSTIRARRAIDRIDIGGNFEQGATIDAADIGRFRVAGNNQGTVTNA